MKFPFPSPKKNAQLIFAFCLLPFAFCLPSAFTQSPAQRNCLPVRPIPIDRWQGEYFNNADLSGSPATIRDDSQPNSSYLEFDWKLGSPAKDCDVSPDNFSVRWTRTIAFGSGSYRFTVIADDGVRLFIDGQEKLSRWNDHTLTSNTADVMLTAGNHRIVLEYYERWGSAAVSLKWQQHPCIATVAPDHWSGEYFNNDGLNGQPVAVRDDGESTIYFDWQEKSPNPICGVSADNFSARWTRRAAFGNGVYRFEISTDAGARVFIDGKLQFDGWRKTPPGNFFDLQLGGGNHQIVFEYRSATGNSIAGLRWKPLPCIDQVPEDHWRGEYFNSDNLSGQPVMVRDDGDRQIDFNWTDGSPADSCGVRRDSFSARWTRTIAFAAGQYRFVVAGNDGIRFYVDGELKLDEWREQSASFIVDVELSSGRHQLKLEYVDFVGRASVKLAWQPPPCRTAVPAEHWRGEYFANKDLAGRPMVVRDEGSGSLDFDWQLARPHTDCFNLNDNFSARWTRTVNFAAGTYRFNVMADDGVRLFVDGKLVIDGWRDQAARTYSADLELSAGTHRIVLEYYEAAGSALAKLNWAVAPCSAVVAAERWRGEYFNNTDLTGKPVLVRDEGDSSLNFDWGLRSPDSSCGVNIDNFSARWTRNVTFGEGIFRFTVTGDDGIRVFIDNQLKFDRWQEQMLSESFDVPLTAGNHLIRVEYFERWGSAAIKLSWAQHPCFATVAPDHWRAEYFGNTSLSGQPAMVRDDGDGFLNFD